MLVSAALYWSATVADPDLQIREGPGHPDPEISGGRFQKNFFGPWGLRLVYELTGAGPPAPLLVPPLNYTPHQRNGYSFLSGTWA